MGSWFVAPARHGDNLCSDLDNSHQNADRRCTELMDEKAPAAPDIQAANSQSIAHQNHRKTTVQKMRDQVTHDSHLAQISVAKLPGRVESRVKLRGLFSALVQPASLDKVVLKDEK